MGAAVLITEFVLKMEQVWEQLPQNTYTVHCNLS